MSKKKHNRNKKHTASKTVAKNTSAVFKVLSIIALLSLTTFFLTGCDYQLTYNAECDQTAHGRGNIPESCRGLSYAK